MELNLKKVRYAATVALGLLAVPVTAMAVRFAIYAPYFAGILGE